MEIAALPIRDCVGDVVEKHCWRCDRENEGAKKVGSPLFFRAVRGRCLKQAWGMEVDMAMGLVLVCVLNSDLDGDFDSFLMWLAANKIT